MRVTLRSPAGSGKGSKMRFTIADFNAALRLARAFGWDWQPGPDPDAPTPPGVKIPAAECRRLAACLDLALEHIPHLNTGNADSENPIERFAGARKEDLRQVIELFRGAEGGLTMLDSEPWD